MHTAIIVTTPEAYFFGWGGGVKPPFFGIFFNLLEFLRKNANSPS